MPKKIVFMGTPEFSVQTLKTLAESKYDLVCVYSQPPKKSSRGQKIKQSPVQVLAKELNLQTRTPDKLDSKEEFNFFKSLKPYIVIVVAYGKLIPKKYLNIPEKGFINIHASLLPKWRGAAPIQRSIMNRDKETGISIMQITEGLDSGPYMMQVKKNINQQTNADDLSKKLSNLGAKSILESLSLIEVNQENFVEQDNEQASYAKKIDKIESKINWHLPAEEILAKINGLNPAPGAWFEFKGSRYKVWKADISNLEGKPGIVLDHKLIIGCKKKSLKIFEIQKQGKNKLTIEEFIPGSHIFKGEIVN